MSNEKRFSYLLVAALAASFSSDAAAQETNDTLELDPEGEWRPVETTALERHGSMIETSSGWGVEIDRVRFSGEGFDVELETRGQLEDLQLVLRPDDSTDPMAREVAAWLDAKLQPGDSLYRQMDEWSFSGKLYAPGVDGRPGDRSIAIDGALPLHVDVTRTLGEPSVVVDVALPTEIFEVDWQTFRDRLKLT